MILPILNEEIHVGDVFECLVDKSVLAVCEIKPKGRFFRRDGSFYERKEPLVILKDRKSEKTFETNLITVQTLLMRRIFK